MKIIFFGAGSFAYNACKQLFTETSVYIDEYLAFADNDSNLWGKQLFEKAVIEPSTIHNYEVDLIVITSIYEKEIRRQLIEELKISKDRIYTFTEYSRKIFADRIYQKQYGKIDINKKYPSNNIENLVVYTAIIGNHDSLKEPLFLSDDITYVCFTNNREIKSKTWNVEYIENNDMDDIHLVKHIKMNPHNYFSNYEMSVWVDGKYQILDDFRTYIAQYRKQSSILCFPHPERLCICNELAACILGTNANKKDMIMQVSDYLRNGFPLDYGLYEGGCIMRIHNDEAIKNLMEKWENEVKKYSFRDQLSLPYVCWKNGIIPDICNLDINRNQWLLQKRTLY